MPPPFGEAPRESLFEELERYVRFGPADLDHLRAFHPKAAPHFERIATEFYERIREHEDAHAIFTGEEQVARLQRSLVRWLHRILTEERDDRYFAETGKIGSAHVRVGLPQRYVLAAMALIRVALERIVEVEMGDRAADVRESLAKALDLEIAFMLETYCEDFAARIRRMERIEREDLGRALARSERRYVHAVELAPYLVVGVDAQGRILLFNREAERVKGLGRDEVVGRAFLDVLVAGDEKSELSETFERVLRDDGASARAEGTFDAPLLTRAGHHRKVRWHVVYAPSDDGAAGDEGEVVAIATGRDVTDEDARAERARQVEKLAAVGTLAAGLAHEIRNPLNGAQLHVTYLRRGLERRGGDPEALDAVKVVSDEIKRLSNLVDEFLDFARPKPLERTPVALKSLCRHALQMAQADAVAASVALRAELPEADVVVEIDPGRIEQVLLNLLHNAIEALAPGGRGTVVLRARRAPLHFVLEVEDDGPGLPPGPAPVFDAFYTTKPSGTGLGLAIVHRIVTDHGGAIAYESRPGRTVFRATIPIVATPDPDRGARRGAVE